MHVDILAPRLNSEPRRSLGCWVRPPREHQFGGRLLTEADGLFPRHGEPHRRSHTLSGTWWCCAVAMGTRSEEIWARESDGRHRAQRWSVEFVFSSIQLTVTCNTFLSLLYSHLTLLVLYKGDCFIMIITLLFTQKELVNNKWMSTPLSKSLCVAGCSWWC